MSNSGPLATEQRASHYASLLGRAASSKMGDGRTTRHALRLTRGLCVDPFVLLVILFSLFPIGPLLQPGYFWGAHDARHSVYFLFELDRGIQDGILYPRWQPDFAFGYGYPFFNIYGPLSSYVGEAFHLLGFGFTDSVKIVFALSVVGSGLAMYGFVKQVMGQRAGLVAAVAYMFIPYRMVDLYVRASLAEAVATVFVPLVLWGVWDTLHHPRWANVVGLAFAYAALIFTHPLTGMLLTLILTGYVAVLAVARVGQQQPWGELSRESLVPWLGHLGHVLAPAAVGLVLGLYMSAFFVVPAMTENPFVRVDQWYGGRYAWGGDFVEFYQLFSPTWGTGASVPGPNDGVSFQLGVVPLVLSLFAVVSLLRRKRPYPRPNPPPRRGREKDIPSRGEREADSPSLLGREQGEGSGSASPSSALLVLFFGALSALVVLLMLDVSAPLWAALPLARLAQFPWRLLALTVVSMAFLCGAVAWEGSSERRLPGLSTLVLVALLVLGSLPYIRAEMSEREVSLAGLMQFQQSSDEMTGSTAWVRRIPRWSPMADYAIAGKPLTSKVDYGSLYRQPGRLQARTLERYSNREMVEYSAERSALVTLNTFYYPGWHAYLLNRQTNAVLEEMPIALRGELGLMTVRVPAGVGRVLFRFESTPMRKLSAAASWASLALVLVLTLGRLVIRRRDRRRPGRNSGAPIATQSLGEPGGGVHP